MTQIETPLFFAGPSGHGKSELGHLLGKLLSWRMHSVDVAGMKCETDSLRRSLSIPGVRKGLFIEQFLGITQ